MAALRLGLTGGIGSGKSTIGSLLAAQGAFLIDADALSRQCTGSGGAAVPPVAAQFGAQFVSADGSMDRAAMRALVFSDASAKRRLESIVHPLVVAEIQRLSAQADTSGARCVVLDIPLLVESGHWRRLLDRVLVVDCSAATQIARVCRRSAMTPPQVQAIIDQQASRKARRAAADLVLHNEDLNLDALRMRVHEIGQQFGL